MQTGQWAGPQGPAPLLAIPPQQELGMHAGQWAGPHDAQHPQVRLLIILRQRQCGQKVLPVTLLSLQALPARNHVTVVIS